MQESQIQFPTDKISCPHKFLQLSMAFVLVLDLSFRGLFTHPDFGSLFSFSFFLGGPFKISFNFCELNILKYFFKKIYPAFRCFVAIRLVKVPSLSYCQKPSFSLFQLFLRETLMSKFHTY